MPVDRKGRNGGTLRSMQKGDPALPGAGRPRKLPAIDDILSEVLGENPDDPTKQSEAKEVLKELLKSAKGGNVKAQIAILDRAYGKPKQQIDANVNIGKQEYKISDDLTIEL